MEEKHGVERGGPEGHRRRVGVEAHGIRLPVIQRGDDLVRIVAESLIEAACSPYAPFALRDRDVSCNFACSHLTTRAGKL